MTEPFPACPQNLGLVEELGMLMARCHRLMWAEATRRLGGDSAAMLTWPVLICLVRGGPCTQKDLAERAAQHPAGVSRMLDEMESQQLVQRVRDASDRRRVIVDLTEQGRARFEVLRGLFMEALDAALGGLDDTDRQQLRTLLRKMISLDTTAPEWFCSVRTSPEQPEQP